MSTLFEMFNGPQQPQPQQPAPNFFAQLQQFARTFSGNPEQIVRNMLQTGQMSQQQFDQLSQQASQIQAMMGLR